MTQPRITPSEVEVAEAAKTLLPNGVALYTLASEDFEVLRISFVFRAGSALQRRLSRIGRRHCSPRHTQHDGP